MHIRRVNPVVKAGPYAYGRPRRGGGNVYRTDQHKKALSPAKGGGGVPGAGNAPKRLLDIKA